MKIAAAFLLILNVSLTYAQSAEGRFTGIFSQTPAVQALTEIEAQTQIRIYYQLQWLDSLKVNGEFKDAPIREVLTTIFEGTSLSVYLMDEDYILTNNSIIIEEPQITRFYKNSTEPPAVLEKGLIFSREYQEDESDIENFVFEIGNRSRMSPGGKSTIAGYLRDGENSEPIEGALVYVEKPFTSTSTDKDGFFSITLPNGKNTLLFQYYGMKATRRNVVLFSNGKLNVDMDPDVIALREVTVEADRDINITNVQMGVQRVNVESAKVVPIVLGEKDIMKIATTLPGVQNLGEGSSGYNVRGGKTDQNLILLNDMPVYNTSHFFGFFSVFNSEALQNMELYKSGIPAKYGGRLSSVFEIQSKVASKEEVKGEGGLSPVTSRLTLEIPLVKDKTSLLVGGRSTYSNWILSRINNAFFNENRVTFYDLITHVDHEINEKNSVSASGYFSNDLYRLNSDTLFSFSEFSHRNLNGSVQWRHHFNDHLEGAFSAIFSRYNYDIHYNQSPPNAFRQDFGLSEKTLKAQFGYYIGEIHKIDFGGSFKHYRINPGSKLPTGAQSIVADRIVPEEQALESAFHLSDQFEVNKKLSLYGGLRYVIYQLLGPADVYRYTDNSPKNNDTRLDTTNFHSGQIVKTYHGPELRLSARYSLNDLTSLKVGLGRTRQYIHTLSNSASLSPTDIWRLSNVHILPQTADQVSVGIYRNLFGNKLETSVETYYKRLHNLLDFKVGANFLLNETVETDVLQGPGKSYGVEVSIKKSGKFNGWLNYTYARTFIKLDGKSLEENVNGGDYFPTNYDKPHTVNMVANYKLTRRISVSLNLTYNTGRPVTYPVALYEYKNIQAVHYSERNAYRIPDYFRTDLGINLEGNHKIKKLAHSFWSLSIYNVTGRDNPYSIFFDVRAGEVKGYQLIVFGSAIPTLSYNFKF